MWVIIINTNIHSYRSQEGLKDFYNRLEELVATVTNSNHIVFMGDQNAKIRRDTVMERCNSETGGGDTA